GVFAHARWDHTNAILVILNFCWNANFHGNSYFSGVRRADYRHEKEAGQPLITKFREVPERLRIAAFGASEEWPWGIQRTPPPRARPLYGQSPATRKSFLGSRTDPCFISWRLLFLTSRVISSVCRTLPRRNLPCGSSLSLPALAQPESKWMNRRLSP